MCPCLKIIEIGDEVEFLRATGPLTDWPSYEGLRLLVPGSPRLGFPRYSYIPSFLSFAVGDGMKENYGGVVAEIVKAKEGASFFILNKWPNLLTPITFAQPVRKTCRHSLLPLDPLKRFSFL